MLRVPGLARRSARRCSARGGDVRVVYSPLDAVELARAQPRPAGRLLRHRLRDHRAGERDGRAGGAKRRASRTSRARLARARAAGDRGDPDRRTTGCRRSSAPGHVCAVMGCDEYEPIAARYRRADRRHRLRAARPARGHPELVRQLEERPREVENQYARACRRDGNAAALAGRWTRCSRSATASGEGSARSRERLCASRRVRAARRRARFRTCGGDHRRASPRSCISRRGPARDGRSRTTARRSARMHARDAARRDDGLGRRRLRRVLPSTAGPAASVGVSGRGGASMIRLELAMPGADRRDATDAARPRQRRQAHGRADRATCSSRRSRTRLARSKIRRCLPVGGGSRLAFTTDSFVVTPALLPRRRHRRARRERHRQRPRDGGRAPARALRWRSSSRRASPMADLRRDRRVDGGRRARAPGCGSSPATRRSSSAARPTASTSPPPASALVPDGRRAWRSERARPGDRILVSGHDRRPRHRHHVAQRGASSFETELDERYGAAHRARRGDARRVADVRAMRDPTRGGLASALNELARRRAWVSMSVTGADPGAATRPRRRASCSGSIRSTWRTRASSGRDRRARRRRRHPRGRARPSAGRAGRRDRARCGRPAGRRSGPDRVGRPPSVDHARRRPTPAHLLN